MNTQGPGRRPSACNSKSATCARASQSRDHCPCARKRTKAARWRAWERMAPAAWAADIRPRWQVKAATRRINMPAAVGVKEVARKKALIPGRAWSMIMGRLLPRLEKILARAGQSTNRSGRREGVSFSFVHHRSLENAQLQ